tara:strand:- start:22 stop:648 length:627 start_codon:yes stop_codon:yes gene_type:complete
MKLNKNGQLIYPKIFKLETGSDLLTSLQEMAKKENKAGYILSIVGNLSKARIKCPGKKQSTLIKNTLEIISLNGTIDANSCHLHISFSDGNCNVWAGHLEEGTIILKAADMLIGFLDEKSIKIEKNYDHTRVEIFIIPDCPWSARAIRMLRTLQVEHEIKVIENDNDFKSLKKITNYTRFPQIFINGEFIGGYSELAELQSCGKLNYW